MRAYCARRYDWPMWKRLPAARRAAKPILTYGLLLAAGTLALQWLDYQRFARTHAALFYDGLLAAGFLGLGLWLGWRLLGQRGAAGGTFDGNPAAQASLGISPREMAVLGELAAGLSNKEIARRLDVSPNTVKTHLASLYAKLDAQRRTQALRKARELGLVR